MDRAALITLAVYGAALIGIGVWASRRTASAESFLLAGRSLGPVVAGVAYAASSSSAWVLLGFSGFVYAAGPSALWMIPGILAGYAALWLGAGPVLQRASREQGHLTLTDFLAEGAGPQLARAIRAAASILIAFCFAYYVAAQFQGAGLAFDDLFGVGLGLGVVIGAAVILAYTFLGGFVAVSLIDTIQGLLMAFAAVVLPAYAFAAAGGWDAVSQAVSSAGPTYGAGFGAHVGWAAAGFALGMTATGLNALGQPQLAAWIMAARDRRARIIGAWVALSWALVVYVGMGVLGLSARALFGEGAPAEGVFFASADLLPGVFAGILAAAILSAIMSTVDSQLLVAGAAVSHDLGASRWVGGREVLASRLAIVTLCAAAVALTLFLPSSIFERTLFAWTALGASFGPIVTLRAFGLRPSGAAVLACMVSAFAVSLAYEFWLPSGPGYVWARTAPWAAGFVALGLFALCAPRRTQTLGAAS